MGPVVVQQLVSNQNHVLELTELGTLYQAASLVGGLLGPAIGGLLADTMGIRAPFTFTGTLFGPKTSS